MKGTKKNVNEFYPPAGYTILTSYCLKYNLKYTIEIYEKYMEIHGKYNEVYYKFVTISIVF